MQGEPRLIDALNDILTAELTAINQYFVHAKMCKNWGYERLAQANREESIGEMKHADAVIDRILFLEGVPNMQRLEKVRVGETVPEQLELDLALEMVAVKRLNETIALAVEVGDHATRELVERILISEQEHIDWLEAQLSQVKQLGLPNYLAVQVRPA